LQDTNINQKMQHPTLITVADLDISRISITRPKKNKNGKLNSYLNWNGGAFMIETPNLHSFGVGRFEDKANKDIKSPYNLTVTQRSDQQAEADRFFDFMKGLDDKIIDFLIENSTQILGEEYTREDRKVVAGIYKKNRLIKPSKLSAEKVPYPSALKLAIATQKDEEEDETPMIQVRRGKTSLEITSFEELCEVIPKNTTVRAIITPRIYFMASIVGIKWTVQAVKIPEVRKMTLPTTFTFSDETEAEEGEPAAKATVEDDEAEEEAEGEEEAEAEEEEEGGFEEVEEEE
jgi:hypothetical protein